MLITRLLLSTCLGIGLASSTTTIPDNNLERRQQTQGDTFPSLGSTSVSTSLSASTVSAESSSIVPSQISSIASSISTSPFSRLSISTSSTVYANSGTASSSTSRTVPTSTLTPTASSSSSSANNKSAEGLPLTPRITPALSIGGVILLLTGIVYALIGIKNRWIHVFLSTAYLTSLSICVLIIYVANPPVSNAIQGAYFVGILMTGTIFGAGALIFKEVTEGLGCLLGGFTLAMWFLTLKDGGLITNTTGKAIFITIFCVLAWSLSFSHHTRAYGLIGSTSFSGATAFVLGMDCFSQSGLKEFWLYIWGLNPNLFPLNTSTYPITRGSRVETVAIVLGCIIGSISQIKLWKVVQDRQERKKATNLEEERRREAVEAALGKHLERRNDRDRNQWEKQYGDRLHAKRDTVLWSDTVGENKSYTRIVETEVDNERRPRNSNMELRLMPQQPRSVYVGRVKRQSTINIDAIQEEADSPDKLTEQQKSLAKLEGDGQGEKEVVIAGAEMASKELSALQDFRTTTTTMTTSMSRREDSGVGCDVDLDATASSAMDQLALPEEGRKKKRLSWSSMFSKSAKDGDISTGVSQSQEALVVPATSPRYSRASSLAATLDFENEVIDLPSVDHTSYRYSGPPTIIVSDVESSPAVLAFQREREASYNAADAPPSPPALTENFEFDTEELVRPPTLQQVYGSESRQTLTTPNSTRQHSGTGSKAGFDNIFDEAPKTHTATSGTSARKVLTKGVLDKVPNHLSHVVLSYRTNEWAKHIATAETPMYEEPQSMEDEQSEIPAHLTIPEELQSRTMIAGPSSLDHALGPAEPDSTSEAATSSDTQGIRVKLLVQSVQRFATVDLAGPLARAKSPYGLENASIPRGFRSSSTPLPNQGVQTPSTDQNAAMKFNPRQSVVRSVSAQSYDQFTGHSSRIMSGLYTTAGEHARGPRAVSRLSQVPEHLAVRQQSQSHLGNGEPSVPRLAETRLSSYDSHQPTRKSDNVDVQRRETMLANWRLSQHTQPKVDVEGYRMQMVMQRQQVKAMEEYEKNMKLQQEMVIDARMRSRDMQELHREAMRKMQANANKTLQ